MALSASPALRSPQEDGRSCAYCGGTEFRLLHEWEPRHPRNSASITVGYWECACKLAIMHPVPTADQLPSEGDWWAPARKEPIRNPGFKRIRVRIQNWMFGSPQFRLIEQTRRAVQGGTLLDVGCGQGGLLELAQPYFTCEGLEPSAIAAAKARAKGFRVMATTLEESDLPASAYDVVTMDAVLEHLLDPVFTLSKVHRVLKPGGVVVIKVPKLWGPAHRMCGREWNGFRVAYHTTMFTGRTLANVLRAAGFEPLRSPRRDRWLDDILVMWGRKPSDSVLSADRQPETLHRDQRRSSAA